MDISSTYWGILGSENDAKIFLTPMKTFNNDVFSFADAHNDRRKDTRGN